MLKVDTVTLRFKGTISHLSQFVKMRSQEIPSKYRGQDYYTVIYVLIN